MPGVEPTGGFPLASLISINVYHLYSKEIKGSLSNNITDEHEQIDITQLNNFKNCNEI